MATKRRFLRRDLKQPDEFLTTSDKVLDYLKGNQKIISIIVLVLVILGISGVFFNKNRHVQNMRMEALLHEMSQGKLRGDNSEILEKYIDDFDGINQKIRAKLILGDSYYLERKYDDSIKTYLEIISDSKNDSIFNKLARISLAYCYDQNNNPHKAIKIYKSLIVENNETISLYNVYFALAGIYEREKDIKNAVLILREMGDRYKSHSNYGKVQRKIQKLEKSV